MSQRSSGRTLWYERRGIVPQKSSVISSQVARTRVLMVVKGNELRKPLAAHGSISMMRFVNHIHYHKTHPILRISHAERIGSHNEAMDHGTMKLIEIGKTKKTDVLATNTNRCTTIYMGMLEQERRATHNEDVVRFEEITNRHTRLRQHAGR